MSESRKDQEKQDLFMQRRLMIMSTAIICDEHTQGGELLDQVRENLFDTFNQAPDEKELSKERKNYKKNSELLNTIDGQREAIINKLREQIYRAGEKATDKALRQLCQLQTYQKMQTFIDKFESKKSSDQANYLMSLINEQTSKIPGSRITDDQVVKILRDLGYQNLIKHDTNNKPFIEKNELARQVISALENKDPAITSSNAFRVLQALTYSTIQAQENAALNQHIQKNKPQTEQPDSPAWKQKDKRTLDQLFPVDAETADLKQQAKSLPGDSKGIERRLKLIEREALIEALHEHEDRSPKAKKRFMDANADAIMELYQELDKQGMHKARDEFEDYMNENFIKPVQESILHQAENMLESLKDTIKNVQGMSDKKYDDKLASISRTMTKIFNNLGEDSEPTNNLMERFSELMVKAHQARGRSDYAQEVHVIADEIMEMIKQLSSEQSLHLTVTSPQSNDEATETKDVTQGVDLPPNPIPAMILPVAPEIPPSMAIEKTDAGFVLDIPSDELDQIDARNDQYAAWLKQETRRIEHEFKKIGELSSDNPLEGVSSANTERANLAGLKVKPEQASLNVAQEKKEEHVSSIRVANK